MRSFVDHLLASDKEYHFRVKTIVPMDSKMLNNIERLLTKYELREIGTAEKTIIQKNPMDFFDIANSEVWFVDIIIGVPASAYVLQQELSRSLHIPEKFIVVRSDNDPLELQGNRITVQNDMDEEAAKKGLSRSPYLSTDSEYPDEEMTISGSELYGNEYNKKFLDHLSSIAADRDSRVVGEPAEALFNWLKSDVEAENFNADKDGIVTKPWWQVKGKVSKASKDHISPENNVDEDQTTYKQAYKDDKGKKVVLTRKSQGVR